MSRDSSARQTSKDMHGTHWAQMNQDSMPHYQLSLQRLSDTYKQVDGENSDISVSQNFENNKFFPKHMMQP